MIEEIARVAKHDLRAVISPARVGDPAQVVANVSRIHEELGWASRLGLRDIVSSAWLAHSDSTSENNPDQ